MLTLPTIVKRKAQHFAAIKQDAASGNMLQDIVDRVYDGSVPAVVQQLLESSDLDAGELEAIRQLISRKQKEQRS